MSDRWPEFEALRGLHGDAYARQRDALLVDARLAGRLASALTDGDWLRRTLAQIVAGWHAHGQLYRDVLARIDGIDVAHAQRTIGGLPGVYNGFAQRARRDYKAAILPLCWEALLKFGDVWPAWKVMVFHWMIAAVPDERSVEPVLEYMEKVAPLSQIDSAVNTLRDLPGPAVQAALAARLDALAAALAARQEPIDPRSAALLHLWHKLRDEAAAAP